MARTRASAWSQDVGQVRFDAIDQDATVHQADADAEVGRGLLREGVQRLDGCPIPVMPTIEPELRRVGRRGRQPDEVQFVAGQEIARPGAVLSPLCLNQSNVSVAGIRSM